MVYCYTYICKILKAFISVIVFCIFTEASVPSVNLPVDLPLDFHLFYILEEIGLVG